MIPILVDAGGGLEAQEGLNALLRRQSAQASGPFSSLTQDLLGPGQRFRWKAWAQGVGLRWHTLQPGADASCCDLEQLNNDYQRRFYAATTVVCEQEHQTHLDCDPGSGEVRVWLNDRMVLRACRQDAHYWAGMPFRVAVHLKGGENQLLVQRDRPEFGDVNFRLRLGGEVAGSRPAELVASEHEVASSEPWLLQSIPEEWRLFRADYLFRLGRQEEAHQHLAPWREAYPESALLAWIAGEWEGSPRAGPSIREAIRQKAPEWAVPEPSDCHSFLNRGRLQLASGATEVQYFYFSTPSSDETYAPLIRAVQPKLSGLLARFPRHPWLFERRLQLMTPFCSPVVVEHIPESDLAEAARLMEALAKLYPNGWGWDYRRLAQVHRRLGNQHKASTFYRKAAAYRPTDPDAWEALAENETVPARVATAYRKALNMSPDRVYLRDRIEQCQGATPRLETMAPPQSYRPPWQLLHEEVVWEHQAGFCDVCDSRHPARRILLQEMRQVLYSDGASYGCYRLVAETPQDRVFSPEYPQALRRLRTVLRVSRLYRRDGRVQDTLDLSQGTWPAFPDCEAGDIAEAAWTVSSAGLGGFSQDWDIGPSERYVLIHPTGRPLKVSRLPDASDVKEGWTVDTWTSSGCLRVSTYSKWSELARALRRHLFRPLGPAVEAQARRLGSVASVIRWVEECDSDWEALLSQAEPIWRAMDKQLGPDTSTAVVLCALLAALDVRTDLCFPLHHSSIPGAWFDSPAIQVLDRETYWWRSPRKGTPFLSLSRGRIQLA